VQWNEKVEMLSGMSNRTIQISQISRLKGKNQNIHTAQIHHDVILQLLLKVPS